MITASIHMVLPDYDNVADVAGAAAVLAKEIADQGIRCEVVGVEVNEAHEGGQTLQIMGDVSMKPNVPRDPHQL